MRSRAAVLVSLAAVVAVCGLTASALPRAAFTMYDEGVYYFQAVRAASGEVPYRDFFAPQPPGVLLIGAASERAGAGVVGVRAVNWACGLVLLAQTFLLTRLLAGRDAGAVAAALVAVGVVFAYQSIQGATNMPAACLEMAACLLVAGERRGRFAVAGLVLASATVLRLPSAVALPGLLLLARFAHGPGGFRSRAAWFLGSFGAGCAAIHLSLAAALPGYIDNVVRFQAERTRTTWADRAGQVGEFLTEPATACGLPVALWFARYGRGRVRGVAVHALVTAGAVSVAGNALSVMYYLPVLPPLAACAAAAAGRFPRALVVLPLAVAAISGPVVAGVVLAQVAPSDQHAACVAGLRELPGTAVLTSDGRIAVLAGKRAVPGYYATDPNALYLVSPARFHEWFAEALDAADVVVVTPQLLGWMSDENATRVRACGKPVLFDTAATRDAFGR